MSLKDLWQKAQEEIEAGVGKTSYETWFAAVEINEKNPDTLIIESPDDFFKSWIVEHYQNLLEEIITRLAGRRVSLEFSVNPHILNNAPQAKIVPVEEEVEKPASLRTNLNSRFTFDNFVIGPANRFACAASLAVAESPAKAYNPLFIYGQVGLGKTHLIQAITHKLNQLHPKLKYCYMSSERFTNELIDAIRHRSTSQFRSKYREMDVLLIDDIQFIAGKESTQEEFFHTFNNLHNNRKQIIITSDRPPKDIANLEERLSSRFAWGLITDIHPPDFETRVAILKKKVEHEPVHVPDAVIHFIAEQIRTNIRELEGALIRVVAYSLLDEGPITLEMAKTILKDMVEETSKIISVDMIQKSVSAFFNVPLFELRAKKRHKNIVFPRQVAMYLSRQLTNMSFPEIGNAFGGKDHTTALYSFKKIEKKLAETNGEELKKILRELTTILQH
ncbi:MAG: chromosomal replication initiator protein DnaA [Candidatus Omnitrophica bacterium]|nr:chromosomal replication initiator protein DnaA [Candidatus Omnitrophota bacterium]